MGPDQPVSPEPERCTTELTPAQRGRPRRLNRLGLAGDIAELRPRTIACSFAPEPIYLSRVHRGLGEVRLTWDTMMTTVEPMTARGAHYTALLETLDHQGATKLHAREREQLLEAADALLFGEPENRRLLRSAEELIESLETSERWSAESCDQLREHLYGCDVAPGVA